VAGISWLRAGLPEEDAGSRSSRRNADNSRCRPACLPAAIPAPQRARTAARGYTPSPEGAFRSMSAGVRGGGLVMQLRRRVCRRPGARRSHVAAPLRRISAGVAKVRCGGCGTAVLRHGESALGGFCAGAVVGG
jgi:hypothetical protein